MATILLVEDAPDLGAYEAGLLEAEGHRVIRCGGAPAPFAACPMLKYGECPLPDSADLILFSCALFAPMRHRTYRGSDLLRAYRAHPRYGRLPMVVVSVGIVDGLEGTGPLARVEKFSAPGAVIAAVHALLPRPPYPTMRDAMVRTAQARTGTGGDGGRFTESLRREVAMELGVRITFGKVIEGREEIADALFDETMSYFAEKLATKQLTYFEPFFVTTGDSEQESGFFVFKGPVPEVFRLMEEPAYKNLLARAYYIVRHLKTDMLAVGEGITEIIERSAKVRAEIRV